jgi:hypothetical protein
MASDLDRSEAIEITVFYPGDELLPLVAAQSKAQAIPICRITDQDRVAQDPDLDALATIASVSHAPYRFAHPFATHCYPKSCQRMRTPSDTNTSFPLVSILWTPHVTRAQ